MRIIHILTVVLGLLTFSRATGQSFDFTHYQVENGLSNNTVTCSLMDKKGFIWFGTKDGLNRFDGYNFKIFRKEPGKLNSLGNNFIYCLHQDKDENLWLGTDRGLYRYDYANETFSLLKTNSTNSIRAIVQDTRGNLWFISGADLLKRAPSGSITSYAGLFQATTLCTEGDQLWVGLQQGFIQKYNVQTDHFEIYKPLADMKSMPNYWIETLFSDSPGKIYIGTSNGGVKLFDTGSCRFSDLITRTPSGSNLFTRDFVRRAPDELWIATESGILVYNEQSRQFKQLTKKYDDPYSLSDNAVYTLCKDQEGGIWAGTYFGGLNYYPAQYTPFEKQFPKSGHNSISGNAVREICKDQSGNTWVGTEDAGLNKLDSRTGLFTSFHPVDGKSGLANANIHGLLPEGHKLWIGTFEHGLNVMDLRTEKVVRHYQAGPGPFQLKSNFIYCMLKTKSQKVLIGTSFGLHQYHAKADHFTVLNQTPAYSFYTSLMEDSRGNIWAGTFREGVFFFKDQNEGADPNGAKASTISDLSSTHVTGILESRRHEIWITTESGLFQCTLAGKILKHYTIENGLPSNLLYSLLEDKQQQLWISSSKGLICMNPVNGAVKVFTKSDGLLSDQFNYNSAYQDVDGKMSFGCVKGLITFNPANFRKGNYVRPVYITGFQINNEELKPGDKSSPLKQSIILTDQIVLDHRSSSFSIDFSALNYTSPGSIEYAYKLEGLDQNWTHIQKNRRAYFTELPPGDYVFRVKASANRSWPASSTALAIRIMAPIWKRPIAYLCYAALLGLGIFVMVTAYKRKLQQEHQRRREKFENEKEKEIYHAKIEFFTNVAHEIRTPLTLINAPMSRIMESAAKLPEVEKNLQTMQRNTQRLLTLTNQLLDFRSTETKEYSLNFVKVNIAGLLQEIWMDFHPAAEQRGLTYLLRLPEDQRFAYIDIEAFTKIINNLLDNAIKYAKREVFLELKPGLAVAESLEIEVGSDGKPLPHEYHELIFEPFFRMSNERRKIGYGIGLALARAMTELHNGQLGVGQIQNGYNIFVLTLPIHQLYEFNLKGKWKKR